MNAANECAVAAFIDGKIGFTDICRVSERVLDRHCVQEDPEIEAIFWRPTAGRGRKPNKLLKE